MLDFERAIGGTTKVEIGRVDDHTIQRDGALKQVEIRDDGLDRFGCRERRVIAAREGEAIDARGAGNGEGARRALFGQERQLDPRRECAVLEFQSGGKDQVLRVRR